MLFNAGMGELLDSGTLDGMLDSGTTYTMPPARPHHRHPRFLTALLLLLLLLHAPTRTCCTLLHLPTVLHKCMQVSQRHSFLLV